MSIKKQFSQHANEYNNYNIIQQIAAKALVRDIKSTPKNILEIGCGSGQVHKYINWKYENYTAIDFSPSMCELHPRDEKTKVFCYDFDSKDFEDFLCDKHYDIVISSSALQWSNDLSKLLGQISKATESMVTVLFTSNTFSSIQKITGKNSPILSQEAIKNSFNKYFKCEFEVHNYNLEFSNKKELFDYIKKSGVSGNSNLDFKEAKNLYKKYDLNYLEFEVIFIKAFSKS